uniref:Uncharacterized protein n=1 Tax=Trichuris muris TaxID=70415 RepID=A0A5S6QZT9_TRIMR
MVNFQAEPSAPSIRTWLEFCKAQTIKEKMPAGLAISDDDRQRAWEEGVVDYTGHDSWENIQKRLDRSLQESEQKPS